MIDFEISIKTKSIKEIEEIFGPVKTEGPVISFIEIETPDGIWKPLVNLKI